MSSEETDTKTVLCVDPGVCRLKSKIVARKGDGNISFEIISDCPHVTELGKELAEGIGVLEALAMPYTSNPVYMKAGKALPHSACPVPSAVIKAAEVESGMGLKRPVKFEFES